MSRARIAWIALAILAVPAALLAPIGFGLVSEWHFYEVRPILKTMWNARRSRGEGDRRIKSEEAFFRSFPQGSSRGAAVSALKAESFHCQESQLISGAINCQLRAPADVGYTLWIFDLLANDEDKFTEIRVVIGGISF